MEEEYQYLLQSYDTRDYSDPIAGLVMLIGENCFNYLRYEFYNIFMMAAGERIPWREVN